MEDAFILKVYLRYYNLKEEKKQVRYLRREDGVTFFMALNYFDNHYEII